MYLAIAVLNVVISIPLAKKYGGTGAAIGTCLACIAGQILFMNFYYAKRIKIDIKSYWKSLAKMCLALVPEEGDLQFFSAGLLRCEEVYFDIRLGIVFGLGCLFRFNLCFRVLVHYRK